MDSNNSKSAKYIVGIILILAVIRQSTFAQPLSDFRDGQLIEVFFESEFHPLLQDTLGFIWGYNDEWELVRYDGLELRTFPADPNTYGSTLAHSVQWLPMTEDSRGNIWICYYNGVDKYDPFAGTFEHWDDRLGPNGLSGPGGYYNAFEDSKGQIWITGQGKLFLFEPESDKIQEIGKDINTDVIIEDSQGFIWYLNFMSNPLKLIQVDPSSLKRTNTYLEFPSGPGFTYRIYHNIQQRPSFAYPGKDELTLTVLAGNLLAIDPIHGQVQIFREGLLPDEYVYTAYQEGGTVIIGTSQNRVLMFDVESQILSPFLEIPSEYGEDYILHFIRTNEGALWIVTREKTYQVIPVGPFHFQPNPGKPIRYEGGGRHDFLVSLNGNVYFNNQEGLVPVINDAENPLTPLDFHLPSLDTNELAKLQSLDNWRTGLLFLEDSIRQKTFFIIYTQGGYTRIHEFDAQNHSSQTFYCPLGDSTCVYDLPLELDLAPDGTIWYGGWENVYTLDPETGKTARFTYGDGKEVMTQKYLIALLATGRGDIWLGYAENGVSRYNPASEKAENYGNIRMDTTSLLNNKYVYDILETTDGAVWISATGGLSRWDPSTNQFRQFTKEDGLASLLIKGLHEDDQGRIWAISSEYLHFLEPGSNRFRYIDKRDGLDRPVNSTYGYVDARQNLILLASGGCLKVDLNELKTDSIVPPVYLTDFRVNNVPVNPGDDSGFLEKSLAFTEAVTIPYDKRNFTLEYTALEYRFPDAIRYAYQLQGFDVDWNHVGQERIASYSNLSPGNYTFLLKCYNRHGIESPTPVRLQIHILPPWYRTTLAWLIWILAAIGILFWIYRFLLRRQLALAEVRQLRELDTAKSRLYANISHEFRTPLTVILGNVDMLREVKEEGEGNLLNTIRRNSKTLLQLVNQMLDLSKVEAGELTLQWNQIDVILFSRYLLESFHSLAQQNRIKLEFQSDESSFFMDTDPEKLQQILSNLLANAIKFTPVDGSVVLRLRTGNNLRIEVRDNGIGIPPHQLPYIFDRFYQADDSSTRHVAGTGIGLALTRELVQLLGGTIAVESNLDQGSTFLITLPVTKNAPFETQRSIAEHSPPDFKSKEVLPAETALAEAPLILVIEDNPDVTNYIFSCLSPVYRVMTAANGKEGLETARVEIPDLIISDVMMPEMDGFQATLHLKKESLTCHIPIILLTARADRESRIEGWEQGADEYLAKPFDREELLVRIRNLLENRRRLQERFQISFPIAGKNKEIPAFPTVEDPVVLKLMVLVQEDLMRQWDAESLSSELFLSQTQLYRKLKSLTGMHISEFVRYLRLQQAATLLREDPTIPISSVAYGVGFGSPNEFSRRFKEVFNVTPSEWRS